MTQSPFDSALRLLPFSLAFAAGLLVPGFSTVTYASNAYMRANPAVGSVSTSAGSELLTLLLFLLGAVLTFLATGAALYRIRRDTG